MLLEKLKATKALIERGWITGAYARDRAGNVVPSRAPDACCWCLIGACNAAAGDYVREVIAHISRVAGIHGSLAAWNDTHTKEEVLALLDKAIEHA